MQFSFLGNLGHRVRLARALPPRLVLAKIAKRLPWGDPRAIRVAEVLNSRSDIDAARLIGFYRTQEALLKEANGWEPLDFVGRRVLEIGPGPLAGWGPMALFRGAAGVVGVDPDWVDGVFEDPAVAAAYLEPHHRALKQAFGPLMDYPGWRARLDRDMTVKRVGLAELELASPVDIVLSNSCLEHIDGLVAGLRRVARASADGTRFVHLVNFGNHRDRKRPFATIYEMPPERYRLRYGCHINLMRPSDISRAFAEAGIETEMTVVDRRPEQLARMEVHPYWRDRYEANELEIRTALFVSPQRGRTGPPT